MCNRIYRRQIHSPVRRLGDTLIFGVSRKTKMQASLLSRTK